MRILQCKSPHRGSRALLRFMKETEKLPQPFKVILWSFKIFLNIERTIIINGNRGVLYIMVR
jgi:hypothetical protein